MSSPSALPNAIASDVAAILAHTDQVVFLDAVQRRYNVTREVASAALAGQRADLERSLAFYQQLGFQLP